MQSIPVLQLPFPLFSQILFKTALRSPRSPIWSADTKKQHDVQPKFLAGVVHQVYCASPQTDGTPAPWNRPPVSLDFNALHTL